MIKVRLMAFCCENTRAEARKIFAEIDNRVKRGERDGFDPIHLATIEVLWGEWRQLADGFCPAHNEIA